MTVASFIAVQRTSMVFPTRCRVERWACPPRRSQRQSPPTDTQ